jgi:hypothetical protein
VVRSLERQGILESFVGADGKVYRRLTEKGRRLSEDELGPVISSDMN